DLRAMQTLTGRWAQGLAAAFVLATVLTHTDILRADPVPRTSDKVVPVRQASGNPAPGPATAVQYESTSPGPSLPDGSGSAPAAAGVPAPGMAPADWSPYLMPAPAPGPRPPLQPWKVVFFDNDFSFLNDPDHDYVAGERLKNMD